MLPQNTEVALNGYTLGGINSMPVDNLQGGGSLIVTGEEVEMVMAHPQTVVFAEVQK